MRRVAAVTALFVWSIVSAAPSRAAVRVVATIHPIADVVKQIGRDEVEVVTLLAAGASPHTFEPTPAQMRDVAAARVFVRIGSGLDAWTTKLLAAAGPSLQVVTLTDGLTLLDADDDAHHASHPGARGDPHIWLDPVLVRDHIVPAIVTALSAAAPERSAAFASAAAAYRDALGQLDAEIQTRLAGFTNRKFIAFHSAWRYFARRYRLEQVAVIEAFPGREPSAREIQAIVQTARAGKIGAVLVEPQFSPRMGEQIAREFDGTAVFVDALGGPTVPGRQHYVDLLRFDAGAIAGALR